MRFPGEEDPPSCQSVHHSSRWERTFLANMDTVPLPARCIMYTAFSQLATRQSVPGRCFHWEAWVHILVLNLCTWDLPGQKGHGQRGYIQVKELHCAGLPLPVGLRGVSGVFMRGTGDALGGGRGSGQWKVLGLCVDPLGMPTPHPSPPWCSVGLLISWSPRGDGDLAGHSGEHSFAQGLVVT